MTINMGNELGDWMPLLMMLGVLGWAFSIVGVCQAVISNHPPVEKLMWVFIIVMMPLVGFFIWWCLGSRSASQKIVQQKRKNAERIAELSTYGESRASPGGDSPA